MERYRDSMNSKYITDSRLEQALKTVSTIVPEILPRFGTDPSKWNDVTYVGIEDRLVIAVGEGSMNRVYGSSFRYSFDPHVLIDPTGKVTIKQSFEGIQAMLNPFLSEIANIYGDKPFDVNVVDKMPDVKLVYPYKSAD